MPQIQPLFWSVGVGKQDLWLQRTQRVSLSLTEPMSPRCCPRLSVQCWHLIFRDRDCYDQDVVE